MGGAVADAFDQVFSRATRATVSESLFHSVGARALNPLTRRFYEDIAFAIERRKKLEITYESASGEKKERVIRPVKILSSESFFYLLAMPDGDWAKGDFIKYRVDRLRALKVLPEEFPPLPPGRVSRAIGEATTIWGVNDGKPEKVVLRACGAAADFVRSKEILPRQKVSKPGPGGAVTVTGVIRHRMEAIPLVLHWLPEISVLEPEGLKRDIRQRIEAYLKK
jgi:predicted DNA-binding transcriptional regulator YafY